MNTAVKYMFDRDFDDLAIMKEIVEQEAQEEADEQAKESAEPEAPPPPTYSEEDLTKARQEAYERGKKDGSAEVLTGIEQKIAAALDKVAATLEGMIQVQSQANEATKRDAAALAVGVVRRLFPKLDAEHGPAEVIAVLEDVLHNLIREPRITLLVNDTVADGVQDRIRSFLERRGFQGEIAIRGDSALSPGDCRIEWIGGEAIRDSAALIALIEAAASRHSGVEPLRFDETQG